VKKELYFLRTIFALNRQSKSEYSHNAGNFSRLYFHLARSLTGSTNGHLLFLLTNSIQLSPSREAARFATTQEFPNIL
jgi:hypothetical protein